MRAELHAVLTISRLQQVDMPPLTVLHAVAHLHVPLTALCAQINLPLFHQLGLFHDFPPAMQSAVAGMMTPQQVCVRACMPACVRACVRELCACVCAPLAHSYVTQQPIRQQLGTGLLGEMCRAIPGAPCLAQHICIKMLKCCLLCRYLPALSCAT